MKATGDDEVRRHVRAGFGVELGDLRSVGFGADTAAELWRGTAADGSAYAVKLSGGGTDAALAVTDRLARAGVPGVPGPVRTLDGRLFATVTGRRLSLVPWVSDVRALAAGLTPEQWQAFGRLLARVHATPLDHLDDVPAVTVDVDAFGALARSVDAAIVGGGTADHLVHDLGPVWRTCRPLVATVLAGAVALADGPAGGTVLCHGDPHLGNVLLDGPGEDTDVWLVDWDDARRAPREHDLLFVLGGGVLAFRPVTPPQRQWFLDGYGPVDVDPVRLAFHRCVRALEDTVPTAAAVVDLALPAAERAEQLEILRGVVSPTGLLRVAAASAEQAG